MTIAQPRSLYVHVPFCAHRCGYCDFVTTSRSPELHGRYVAALATELSLRSADETTFDTVFVGGGTPTLLEPAALESLLAWLRPRLADGAELTIECNPETVDAALAERLVAGGVSRVSLGAQSFVASVLETLERSAAPDTVRSAVRQLRAAGIEQLSLDLIWGVPGQQVRDVATDLEAALELDPDHLSAYELELKPGTRMAHRFAREDASAESHDQFDEMYDLVVDRLGAAGWWWYETANFARRPQHRCRHNLGYWHAEPWHAVGVGAVGTLPAGGGALDRRTNLPNVPRWLEHLEQGVLPPQRVEHVDARVARTERVMLGLRLDEPVLVTAHDLADEVVAGEGIERAAGLQLLDAAPRPDADGVLRGAVELRLTRRGRMLQRAVAGMLLDP